MVALAMEIELSERDKELAIQVVRSALLPEFEDTVDSILGIQTD